MTAKFILVLLAAPLLLLPVYAGTNTGTADELAWRRAWVAARFDKQPPPPRADPGLIVFTNHGPVLKNARAGKPLCIAGTNFARGLLGHAPSRLLVRLPGPGETFRAVVGLDSNEQTRGGRGSVDFVVEVGGTEKFRSGVRREGMAGQPVQVALEGATEFVLRGDETADGFGWDHADWVEARVQLRDGREVWLDDLPVRDADSERDATEPPFSFTYDSRAASGFLGQWTQERTSRPLEARRTERVRRWTDPRTGLQVRWTTIEYADFPTVEWTLHFQNTGSSDTPILSEIQALDFTLRRPAEGEFVLHHLTGDNCTADSYQPHALPLKPGTEHRFSPAGGRPTTGGFPYFNLEHAGGGLIVVVGWPGQWAARFTRDADRGLRVRAGQELTRFTLRRSVPLLRSDYPLTSFNAACAEGQQAHTLGISLWMPFHGTGMPLSDAYTMRSGFGPAYRLGWDVRDRQADLALLRRTVAEFRQAEPFLLGDFYPLTTWSLALDVWVAWQYDRPEQGQGLIQAFRRADSPYELARFRLRGLEADARYAVTDLDALDAPRHFRGRELMEDGLPVTLRPRRSSGLLTYRRARGTD